MPTLRLRESLVSLSRMSARRGVQENERNARRNLTGRTRGRVTAIGADEPAVRVNGEKTDVGAVKDAATGEALGREALAERDSDGFAECLGDFARDFGSRRNAAPFAGGSRVPRNPPKDAQQFLGRLPPGQSHLNS